MRKPVKDALSDLESGFAIALLAVKKLKRHGVTLKCEIDLEVLSVKSDAYTTLPRGRK